MMVSSRSRYITLESGFNATALTYFIGLSTGGGSTVDIALPPLLLTTRTLKHVM